MSEGVKLGGVAVVAICAYLYGHTQGQASRDSAFAAIRTERDASVFRATQAATTCEALLMSREHRLYEGRLLGGWPDLCLADRDADPVTSLGTTGWDIADDCGLRLVGDPGSLASATVVSANAREGMGRVACMTNFLRNAAPSLVPDVHALNRRAVMDGPFTIDADGVRMSFEWRGQAELMLVTARPAP